jgi:ABC-type sulfate/molybdate transport systems ATPase subunit
MLRVLSEARKRKMSDVAILPLYRAQQLDEEHPEKLEGGQVQQPAHY